MMWVHSIKSLQETFEARASEWSLTGATLTLSAVFFLNDTMFYRDGFQGLRDLYNDRLTWAALFFAVGILRFTVLTVNGAYYRTPHFRALTAFLCSGVWFLLCMGFARNGSVLIALVPWIFLLDAYNVARASREASINEFKHRYLKKRDSRNAGLAQASVT